MGDLGKTAVQLIRGSKSSRNIAQFGEKIMYKPLKLSGSSSRKHGIHVLRWHLSGHETAIS